MTTSQDLDQALRGVREIVAADGGGLEVRRFDSGHLELDLLLADAECAECVMPRQFLEQVASDMISPHLGELQRVTIHDPRETS